MTAKTKKMVAAVLFLLLLLFFFFNAYLSMFPTSPMPDFKPIVTTMSQRQASPESSCASNDVGSMTDSSCDRGSPYSAVASSRKELDEMRRRKLFIASLPDGYYNLVADNTMNLGDRRVVEASVGVNINKDDIRLADRQNRQAVEGLLKVSSEMIAILDGPGFLIVARTPEQQSMAEGLLTMWLWEIEAKIEGEQELTATFYALIPSDGGKSRQRIASRSQKIVVVVKAQTWGEWVRSMRESIDDIHAIGIVLGGGMTALLGWIGFSRKRDDNRKQKNIQ